MLSAYTKRLMTVPPVSSVGRSVAIGRRLRSVKRGDTGPRTDDELLGAVASGDQAALGELFDRVGSRMYGVIQRIVRDPAQSEEVTQEVMLEVWRSAARFERARGTASAWILTMAHRRAIDRVRSEQAFRDRTRRIGIRDHPQAFDDASEQLQLREEHQEVSAALSALSSQQREAIELAYYHGYTHREVAQLLDTPLGTIKTHMREGLLRLREAMEVDR